MEAVQALAAPPYAPRTERAIWLQIYDRLSEACLKGGLHAGARLPGENALAEMFAVSRLTMRKALSKLQQEGQLQARKGVGIFVRRGPTRYAVDDDLRFFESFEAQAESIETQTLELTRAAASAPGRAALLLTEDDLVVRLTRLRVVQGEPLYLTTKEFPAARFAEFETAYAPAASVQAVYRAHGIHHHTRAETRVSGGFATVLEAEALQLSQRTPLLRVAAVNCDPEGVPIEFTLGRWPLGAVELVFGPARLT